MFTWRLAIAAPLIAAAAVCTTTRHTRTPAVPAADRPSQAAAAPAPAAPQIPAPDFDRTVKPILEKHCHPCHFTGGVMYEKLPFDRAETIRTLGEKLFTRIKAPEEQAAIRAFLTAARD
jgi:cytochrome c5